MHLRWMALLQAVTSPFEFEPDIAKAAIIFRSLAHDLRDNRRIPDMRSVSRLIIAAPLVLTLVCAAQTTNQVFVTVFDENGVGVASARVTVEPPSPAQSVRCETGISGRCAI